MALDKLVDSSQLDSDLTSVANAIRTKGGTSAQLAFPSGFVSAISAIPSGGGGISADDIATGNVTHINLTGTTISQDYAFAYLPIQTISAPNLTTLSNAHAFSYCRKLGTIIFPELTTMSYQWSGNFSYAGGTDLSTTNAILVFPKLNFGTARSTFDRGRFKKIDLGPTVTNLPNDTFYHNTGQQTVEVLILRKADGVVTASNSDGLIGLRDVYIPKTMYDHLGDNTAMDYQAATNWATRFANGYITFHSIAGSAYDGYWADGTPIS